MTPHRLVWGFYLFASGVAFCLLVFLVSAFVYNSYFARYDVALPAYAEANPAAKRTWTTDDPEVVRILAIDGGALLGLAELEVLRAIEETSGRPIHELFDFVAGSSTGAIIGALLLLPKEDTGKPRTVAEVVTIYEEFAAGVLNSSVWHRVLTVNGLFGPLFTNTNRIEIAKRLFGDATFGDLVRPAMFPAFVDNANDYVPFRNWEDDNSDLLLSSLLTAVTSAPIMFPSIRLSGYGETETVVSDPGYVINSPAQIAYIKAREEQPKARKFVIVTLSAAGPLTISEDALVHSGAVQLALTLSNMVFAGQRSLSKEALAAHSKYNAAVEIQSFVIAPVVDTQRVFDASEDNVSKIRNSGVDYAKQNADLIETIVAAIDPSGPSE